MAKSEIAIILVNYNGEQLTLDCIKSINKGTKIPDIVLVDNASEKFDKSKFEMYQNVIVIQNKKNLGFSGGNNIGIQYALKNGYKFIGILNNDTIIDENMIDILLNKVDYNTLVTPKMYYYNQSDILWYAGGYINYFKGEAFHIGMGEKDYGQYDSERLVEFATGCCWLACRDVFEKMSGLSEEYFMYCEDTDFCLRCKREGIRIRFVPSAKLWHKVGASSEGESVLTTYYRNRNRLYLIKKHKLGVIPYYFTLLSRLLKYFSSFILHNNNYVIKQAYFDYKYGKMGKQDVKK